ncbi:hypothetical protein BGX24_006228, partial [Mortierella sp. AD032]
HNHELFMAKYTCDAEGRLAKYLDSERCLDGGLVKEMFSRIIDENNRMLGVYACNKMWREMARSFIRLYFR